MASRKFIRNKCCLAVFAAALVVGAFIAFLTVQLRPSKYETADSTFAKIQAEMSGRQNLLKGKNFDVRFNLRHSDQSRNQKTKIHKTECASGRLRGVVGRLRAVR